MIALDLKGFSDSDKPILRHNYRPNVICKELREFLEALDVKSVTIVGHDLGGLLGWILALKFPELVKKLIVISAPHPNLFWNTSKTALISKKWCKMVQVGANMFKIILMLKLSTFFNFKIFLTCLIPFSQMPFLPEYNLNSKSKTFFERFYKNPKMFTETVTTKKERKTQENELLLTYKYIFKNSVDWTGPLNYFRNFLFYRVKSNVNVR